MRQCLAKKIGMSQIFDPEGNVIPVTVLTAEPLTVIRKKTKESDGYEAIEVGFDKTMKERNLTSPVRGHLKKRNLGAFRVLKELHLTELPDIQTGQELKVSDLFKVGDFVDASSSSKGKGFQGTMKRHNFGGGPASHGGMSHRRPASAGETNNAKVYRGKRSPGHMGNRKVTIQGLEVVRIEPETNLMLLKGAVPGAGGSLVFLKTSVKSEKKLRKKQTALTAKQQQEAAPAKEKGKGKAKKA